MKASAPDWRDPKQYPDPADTGLHRWAWEFLRRNPAFEAEAKAAGKQNLAMKGAGNLPPHWRQTPLGVVMAKWGIADPNATDFLRRVRRSDAPVFDAGPWPAHRRAAQPPTTYAITFDLGAPLDTQLDRARSMLETQQRFYNPAFRRGRNRAEKFPLYLRALDALAAGATPNEMLDAFSGELPEGVDKRKLDYWIKAATALRDGGYRDLLKQ